MTHKMTSAIRGMGVPRNLLSLRPSLTCFAATRYLTGSKSATQSDNHGELQEKPVTFIDILRNINDGKDRMNVTNPLFPVLRDNSISARTRMSFVPYMLSFSVGAADYLSSELRVVKPEKSLTTVEKLVNEFINEDDFHYNYYLRDVDALGYKLEDFGNLEGVMRFVWSPDGLATRKLVNSCIRVLGYTDNPIIRMTVVELLEAGLVELFTTIYTVIAKGDNDLPTLDYFGDTHVALEANHQVTAQFSGKECEKGEQNEWKHEQINPEAAWACYRATNEILDNFDQMYRSFHRTIIATHEGCHVINPSRFRVTSDPPIGKILG